MPELTLNQRKAEFKQNYATMTESDQGLAAYYATFSDQSKAENLLATGGGEELGSIETELASLSAMNEIRMSERQQAFKEDKVFASDVVLNMRDKAYIEATGEINRRKKISTHRYDKTRKDRLETSQKTMEKANTKIRVLKERLNGENGQQPARMQKVRSLEEIYDNIRVADRNFSEALALNKQEEAKLKNKAELTYRCSLKRMYEREMQGLAANSQDYRQIKRKYDENLRYYNELMRPVLEERARKQDNAVQEGNVRREISGLNRQAQRSVSRPVNIQNRRLSVDRINAGRLEQPRQARILRPKVLLDKGAEENVSANVDVFRKFNATLKDAKYGRANDPEWTEMKNKANSLLEGWENKSDVSRGKALSALLISANKLLCKTNLTGSANTQRKNAAKQFRNFFKTTLSSMSMNCRVIALDEIFKDVDRMSGDKNVSDALKKQNDSVFSEMAKDMYIEEHSKKRYSKEELKKALESVDDKYFRAKYFEEKTKSETATVLHFFKNTKNYFLASMKFDFSRNMSSDLLTDNFRMDRFGRVLPEDKQKKAQWEKLFADMAECDEKGAVEIQRRWYQRLSDTKVDKEMVSEGGIKQNLVGFKNFSRKVASIENYAKDWQEPPQTEEGKKNLKREINEWNKRQINKKDMITMAEVKNVDKKKLIGQWRKMEKLPVIKARNDVQFFMEFSIVSPYLSENGIFLGDRVKSDPPDSMGMRVDTRKFVKEGKTAYFDPGEGELYATIIHRDLTPVTAEQDTNGRDLKLRQNRQNPIMFKSEANRTEAFNKIDAQERFLTSKVDLNKAVKRIETREDRMNKVEKGSMDKLKKLCEKKLSAQGKNELKALETLFDEYMKEADKQIYARENTDECNIEAEIKQDNGDLKSAYYDEAVKYQNSKKSINSLFDKLEKAQETFLKKYAGEAAYSGWKKELEKGRNDSRKKEKKQADDGKTDTQRMRRAFDDYNAMKAAEEFSKAEQATIKRNIESSGRDFVSGEVDRVLNTFILPVNRDFAGVPLSERDRYNAGFNKRFKEAVLKDDRETLKALSREFTNNVLSEIKLIPPEQLENMTDKDIADKYCTQFLWQSRIKLCMPSDVQNKGKNKMFPELQTGLDELKLRDKKKYDAIEKALNAFGDSALQLKIAAKGYNVEKQLFVKDDEKKQIAAVSAQMSLQQYRNELGA